jgi:membrane protein implicated in regulation of membrane protease activity
MFIRKGLLMSMLIWWVLLFGLCLLIELSSPGYFFFLSFSLGACGAAGAAWYDTTLFVQGCLFLVIAAASFLFLRRYVMKIEHKGAVRTNVYALQGKKGVVTQEVGPLSRGWVRVEGELWAALPSDSSILSKGTVIQVVGSAGSHLTVKKES